LLILLNIVISTLFLNPIYCEGVDISAIDLDFPRSGRTIQLKGPAIDQLSEGLSSPKFDVVTINFAKFFNRTHFFFMSDQALTFNSTVSQNGASFNCEVISREVVTTEFGPLTRLEVKLTDLKVTNSQGQLTSNCSSIELWEKLRAFGTSN